jgi:glucokinase
MLAIAVDLGGTQIRAALIDESGAIHNRVSRPTPSLNGPLAVVREIVAAVKDVVEGASLADFAGIGVASPGPIDTVRGVTLGLPTLRGFEETPLRDMLGEEFGRAVKLENDGIAAAIGEWRFGAGRGCEDFVYITVSTGIGGGVVSGGQVLRGRMGMAGHVGHVVVQSDGVMCNCGNRGCWEAYAAGPAFETRAERTSGRTFASDAPSVFAAALAGDTLARALVDEEAALLGTGIISLLHLYSPERIVMGGGLCHHFALLKPGIDLKVQAYAMPPFRAVQIVRAAHFGNSGLLGAAALVLPE